MKAGGTIRVTTFNLRVGTAPDGENAWDHRRELLADTIRAADPDLLGTQECLSLQRKFLEDNFPDYELSGVGRDDGKELGESASLLCKRDRFEYLDAGTFWLSKDPNAVGSRSWDAKLPHLLMGEAADARRWPGVVLSQHAFRSHRLIARSESAHLLRKWIAAHALGLPLVLTGDFNADGGSEPYEILRHGGLMDAWRAAHPTPIAEEGTYHAFTGSRTRERIDWIFCSGHFDVLSCNVDYASRNGRFPSDHFPVTAELRLARP